MQKLRAWFAALPWWVDLLILLALHAFLLASFGWPLWGFVLLGAYLLFGAAFGLFLWHLGRPSRKRKKRMRSEPLEPLLVVDVTRGHPVHPWLDDALEQVGGTDVRNGVRYAYRADGEFCELELAQDGRVVLIRTGRIELQEAIGLMRRGGHMGEEERDLVAAMQRAARRSVED